MDSNSIREEADSHLRNAELEKKSDFRRLWRPKFTKAGEEYCAAAILYYEIGEYDESRKSFLNACDCYKKKRSWYSAAKTLEQAMIITKQQEKNDSIMELCWRSSALYHKAGQPDHAATILVDCAIQFNQLDLREYDNSILMLEKAIEIVESENRPIQAASYVRLIRKIYLDQGSQIIKTRYKEIIHWSEKLLNLYMETDHGPSIENALLHLVVLLISYPIDEENKMTEVCEKNALNRAEELINQNAVHSSQETQSSIVHNIIQARKDPTHQEKQKFALDSINKLRNILDQIFLNDIIKTLENKIQKSINHHNNNNVLKIYRRTNTISEGITPTSSFKNPSDENSNEKILKATTGVGTIGLITAGAIIRPRAQSLISAKRDIDDSATTENINQITRIDDHDNDDEDST